MTVTIFAKYISGLFCILHYLILMATLAVGIIIISTLERKILMKNKGFV